jgi:hypothetical protein
MLILVLVRLAKSHGTSVGAGGGQRQRGEGASSKDGGPGVDNHNKQTTYELLFPKRPKRVGIYLNRGRELHIRRRSLYCTGAEI